MSDVRAARPGRQLTPDQHARIRLHIALIPAYIALVEGWWTFFDGLPFGRVGGHAVMARDFAHFYIQGLMARAGDARALYDSAAHAALLAQAVPGHPGLIFPPVYGPQVSLLFAPLAWLRYEPAMYLWMVITVVVYASCCLVMLRRCPRLQGQRWVVAILAVASPALHFTLGFAQASAIGLACLTIAYCALEDGRPFLAGLAVGTLVYKPPLGIAAAFVFILAREWRIVAGAAIAATAQVTAGCLYWGVSILPPYLAALRRLPDVAGVMEAHRDHMHSWRAFFELFGFAQPAVLALYVAASLVTLVAALVCWRARGPLALRFGAVSAATILADPHVYVYDLLLLTPALLTLWDWADGATRDTIGAHFPAMRNGLLGSAQIRFAWTFLLYGCWLTPMLGGVVTTTHVQTSVVLLGALLWAIGALLAPGTRILHTGSTGDACAAAFDR